MRVDLLLIFRLEDKDDLDWEKVVGIIGLRQDELWGGVDRELGGVLEWKEVSA